MGLNIVPLHLINFRHVSYIGSRDFHHGADRNPSDTEKIQNQHIAMEDIHSIATDNPFWQLSKYPSYESQIFFDSKIFLPCICDTT